jgi:hypothetical protein
MPLTVVGRHPYADKFNLMVSQCRERVPDLLLHVLVIDLPKNKIKLFLKPQASSLKPQASSLKPEAYSLKSFPPVV